MKRLPRKKTAVERTTVELLAPALKLLSC
jgi:hypothetical protein